MQIVRDCLKEGRQQGGLKLWNRLDCDQHNLEEFQHLLRRRTCLHEVVQSLQMRLHYMCQGKLRHFGELYRQTDHRLT
jgi:hypothetical protein